MFGLGSVQKVNAIFGDYALTEPIFVSLEELQTFFDLFIDVFSVVGYVNENKIVERFLEEVASRMETPKHSAA